MTQNVQERQDVCECFAPIARKRFEQWLQACPVILTDKAEREIIDAVKAMFREREHQGT